MKSGKKISILGAGNVGATIAYTLTMSGTASEIVLIDINHEKAKGEAMDIVQGTPYCPPTSIYAGQPSDVAGSDIIIVTIGMGRKPGMTRLDLAQNNVSIFNSLMPQIAAYAPDAIYVVVSNPVDILTYALIKNCGIPANRVIGSGTLLDTARLRSAVAEHVGLSPKNVHANVFGEHGDTSVITWSLTSIAGMPMSHYCQTICGEQGTCSKMDLSDIENDVRTAGAKVIAAKGATFYAVALSVRRICESLFAETPSIMTISGLLTGEYGISDVCISIPFVVNVRGILRSLTPPLSDSELQMLHHSADTLKSYITSLNL